MKKDYYVKMYSLGYGEIVNCEYLEPLLVNMEQVNYDFDNYVYMEEE